MPYLSASAVVIHYKEALYQVYVPLHLPLTHVFLEHLLELSDTSFIDLLIQLAYCLSL